MHMCVCRIEMVIPGLAYLMFRILILMALTCLSFWNHPLLSISYCNWALVIMFRILSCAGNNKSLRIWIWCVIPLFSLGTGSYVQWNSSLVFSSSLLSSQWEFVSWNEIVSEDVISCNLSFWCLHDWSFLVQELFSKHLFLV